MPKKSSNKTNKLKNSLSHVVRNVFEKNSSSELSHKQVCSLIDVRENALRKLVFDILENLVQQGVIIKRGYGIYKASNSERAAARSNGASLRVAWINAKAKSKAMRPTTSSVYSTTT